MSAEALLAQAAHAAEAAFTAMRAADPDSEIRSVLIVPPNVGEDDQPPILAMPIPPGTAFPPNDIGISRLQLVLDEGMAVYLCSTDAALLDRFTQLVRGLARMVAPPPGEGH